MSTPLSFCEYFLEYSQFKIGSQDTQQKSDRVAEKGVGYSMSTFWSRSDWTIAINNSDGQQPCNKQKVSGRWRWRLFGKEPSGIAAQTRWTTCARVRHQEDLWRQSSGVCGWRYHQTWRHLQSMQGSCIMCDLLRAYTCLITGNRLRFSHCVANCAWFQLSVSVQCERAWYCECGASLCRQWCEATDLHQVCLHWDHTNFADRLLIFCVYVCVRVRAVLPLLCSMALTCVMQLKTHLTARLTWILTHIQRLVTNHNNNYDNNSCRYCL